MRSSSSAAWASVLAGDAGGFAEWAPEVIPAKRGGSRPMSHVDEPSSEDLVEDAVEAAQAEAERRIAEVEARLMAERDELMRQEYERGYEEGRAEGEIAEGARLRAAVKAAEEALDTLRAGEVRWTGGIEENVCALAVVIARQIIGRELKADISAVGDLVKKALAEFPIDQPIRIRINPNDLNALNSVEAVDGDPLKEIAPDHDARWLPDASIAPGGCVVEGRERIIDGRVDTALERVYRRLTYTNA